MKHGFIKVAAATLPTQVADCAYNASKAVEAIDAAAARGVHVLVLPELCLTGIDCGDLFRQQALLSGALDALEAVRKATAAHAGMLVFVGLPLQWQGMIFNCVAGVNAGQICGIVPRSAPEGRQFAAAPAGLTVLPLDGTQGIRFGREITFAAANCPELVIGVEIGSDRSLPIPPSTELAMHGATVIVNPASDVALVGSAERRRLMMQSQSARLHCAYISASAGRSESTQDTVRCGHCLVAENGTILLEKSDESGLLITDIDVQRLMADRQRANFAVRLGLEAAVGFSMPLAETKLDRYVDPQPFIPAEPIREARCEEILDIQVSGLCKRLDHTNTKSVVIGISGGLDSTLTLLVAARTFDRLGLDRKGIQAITMPGYGTTNRTRSNAHRLAEELGATLREIPIGEAVAVHFRDIGLPEGDHSVTFENAQARERTQVLMDVANMCGGMVIGTGDLSELALGWATYNGDHMSMYDVNGGVPKTLMRHIVRHYANTADSAALRQTLIDILDTPVSPELLPPTEGDISQKTEELVGPYELHDFFLYYVIRWGFAPSKIYRLAQQAWANVYDGATILKWL